LYRQLTILLYPSFFPFQGTWNFRELPYSHDSFLENVVDPAHVPSSHHNVVGNRYADTNPLFVDTVSKVTRDGFKISVKQTPGEGAAVPSTSTTEFVAPSLVKIESPAGHGAVSILELYSSPSRPGHCNHIGRQVVIKGSNGEVPALLKAFLLPMPKWLNHVVAGLFLNQDALFLHAQERMMHEKKEYSTLLFDEDNEPYHYTKAVLPMTADKGVINFRNWVRNKAGGRIPYHHNPSMPPVDNEVVFDIYNSHTKHCKYCMDALKNLRKARFLSYLAAATVSVLRPARLGTAGTALVSVLFGGIAIGINKVIGAMHRLEYSHAEND
jgi:phenylpropionate dioxygenase-like ring-hydroxylating dioxygenase large terminal subunit